MSWTDDRVAVLTKMWGEGKTAAEIAKTLGGVTRNAVIGKAHRLKLSNRASPIPQPKNLRQNQPRSRKNVLRLSRKKTSMTTLRLLKLRKLRKRFRQVDVLLWWILAPVNAVGRVAIPAKMTFHFVVRNQFRACRIVWIIAKWRIKLQRAIAS
jgi:hypothetical protein